MTQDRHIETFEIVWQGIAITIRYEVRWLNSEATNVAHLQIESATRERLPITETGYLSHFREAELIDQAGGPVAYATEWLDHASRSKEWRKYVEASLQLSLF